MQSAEKPQPNEADAAVSPARPEAPLLAQDQISKLQNILRSMDHGQLQSVLAALEPNVLRLCLHAIYSAPASNSLSTKPSFGTPLPGAAPSLALHAKTLAQGFANTADLHPTRDQISKSEDDATSDTDMLHRMSPRTSTQKNAKIYCPTKEVSIDCLILDTSKTGALVFLDHSGELPSSFELYDINGQKADEEFLHLPHKNCTLVWRKRNKLGVTFAD